MTDMRRVTVSIPDDLDKMVEKFRSSDSGKGFSYSEAVRRLLEIGMKADARGRKKR
ncbi:MAG: hypothetical protein ACLTAZ_07590 [Dysosmobacter welbionis]|uniref:hypothetical protein n=1 Tax=Dysosmobacter welbionis TaxID=2093857 RepID=UPI00399352D8